MTYNVYHTSSRVYLGAEGESPQEIKSFVTNGKEEKTYLGVREHGKFIGFILSLFGKAFQSSDAQGKTFYLNTNSFIKLSTKAHLIANKPLTAEGYSNLMKISPLSIDNFVKAKKIFQKPESLDFRSQYQEMQRRLKEKMV